MCVRVCVCVHKYIPGFLLLPAFTDGFTKINNNTSESKLKVTSYVHIRIRMCIRSYINKTCISRIKIKFAHVNC